ncbi:MAG: hypothetical protein S0880_25565 [Actinomycetota bacterium]|nr:hypothetical protein [Actinomycetota bacterium]
MLNTLMLTPTESTNRTDALLLTHALGTTAGSTPRPRANAPRRITSPATSWRVTAATGPRPAAAPLADTCGTDARSAGWCADDATSRHREISGINAQAFGLMNTVKVYDARPEEAAPS